MSPLVTALALTCESKAKPDLYALAKELTPTDGAYQDTLQKAATRDLIPCLGTIDTPDFISLATNLTRLAHAELHLTTLNSSFVHSNLIVEVDGRPLIDFKLCGKLAEQIDTLVEYSPPLVRQTTRPEVLAYVEYSLKSRLGDDTLRYAEERSARLAGEERQFGVRLRRMRTLGFPWSPPSRRK